MALAASADKDASSYGKSVKSLQKCSGTFEQSVNKCLQPILSYANSIQQKTDGTHFSPLQGGDIFKHLCLLYNQFQECTRSTNCESISIKAVDASYGYMCGQGYTLFEEHAACFAEVENEPEYTSCKHAADQSMEDALKLKQNSVDMYFNRLCSVMEDYLSCCRPFVKHKCGQQAWQLVAQITIDSLHVTMPACDVMKTIFDFAKKISNFSSQWLKRFF
uniref:DUF19 domain-containing protein n=1 Tax=Ditylenchus dipsaci TaxID=166011 RepID=A0A915EG97_9BILA